MESEDGIDLQIIKIFKSSFFFLLKQYSTYAVKQVPFLEDPLQTSLGNRTTWKMGKTKKGTKIDFRFRDHEKN